MSYLCLDKQLCKLNIQNTPHLEMVEKIVVSIFISLQIDCFTKLSCCRNNIILTKICLKGDFPFLWWNFWQKSVFHDSEYMLMSRPFPVSSTIREEFVSFIGGRRIEGLSTFRGYLWTDSYLVLIKFRIQSIIKTVQDKTESQHNQLHACSVNDMQSSVHNMQTNRKNIYNKG